ncbi:MAG: hypothetical protein QG611_655 [Bacteroidota bacterium]|nr:hypothetical protein [Bacteroidota bacterium]
MDTRGGIGPQNLPKKERTAINSNILVFTFFLFLSFVFWYLNSLGKELETDIRYPVKYSNLPKDRVLKENLPSRLNLNLKGPGYSILQLKVSGKTSPAVIDFSKAGFKRVPDRESNGYYIVTSGLIPSFNKQLKSVCKVISVKPDTLFFSFSQSGK